MVSASPCTRENASRELRRVSCAGDGNTTPIAVLTSCRCACALAAPIPDSLREG
jgi:hypothetical protein